MLRLVRDELTGFEEWIDFQAIQSANSTARIYDDQTIRPQGFIDHVQGAYPSKFVISSARNSHRRLPVRDVTSTHPCQPLLVALKGHRDFSAHMKRSFIDILKNKDYFTALSAVQAASNRLHHNEYSSTMSEEQIREMADKKAETLRLKIAHMKDDIDACFAYVKHFLASFDLAFRDDLVKEKDSSGELFSLVNRACDPKWWRRQLKRKTLHEVEQVARDLQLVEKHKQVYCSDFSVNRMRERNRSNEIALKETVAYDIDDPENFFTLFELSSKSVSNPAVRRAEMFTRLRGFEEYARDCGDVGAFFTVTAPSRFHAISNSQVNQNWLNAGSPTATDTHNYLKSVWDAFRKHIDKHDVKVYGMRIAEPHQDGTPHHHMLLFMRPEHKDFVISTLYRFAILDTPDEKGAKKHRFKCEFIKKGKSAVGYIAKYLSKNIDGKHIDKDRGSSLDGIEAAERVVTWAKVNRIRQFQFIGGPPVTLWRELRRLREEFKPDDAMLKDLNEEQHFMLENVRKSADAGDWKAFCIAMGGLHVKAADAPVKVAYSVPDAIEKLMESGEYSATKYGDKAQARISGIQFEDIFICTRYRSWATENKELFIKAQRKIMGGVVDWFDALEREKEYERMADERYQQYLDHVEYMEEMEALVLDALAFGGVIAPISSPQAGL